MNPLGILLVSGGHERAHYALMVAAAAAAVNREVTIFATNAGCRLFLRETPLASDPREASLAEVGVAGVAELLAAVQAMGVRRMACEAGLRAAGLTGRPLAPEVEVAGLVAFLARVGEGQIVTL